MPIGKVPIVTLTPLKLAYKVVPKVQNIILCDSVPSDTTEADVKKMMQDRRYWHAADRDPTYIAKVESFFKKKYG